MDIYIPDKKLAIEFNGLYWHSYNKPESPKEKQYHYTKYAVCKNNDIQLLQIFEDEWRDPNKKDIWKSLILNKLGISKKIIYGRKCEIKEIDIEKYKTFCQENHLFGYLDAKIKIGLFHQNELVFVVSFSKSRYDKKFDYELVRLCSKKHYTVVGGASKLLSYFIKNYSGSLISYCDLRYSSGTIYKKLGFTFSHISPPNYFYVPYGSLIRESRLPYQKHKLSKQLENFNPDLSEAQNMFNHGFRRIWDCGQMVFHLKN